MKQEIKHIKAILKDYARLKRDISRFSQVSSPALSPAPAHTRKNGVEISMVNHVDLCYKLKQVEDAINAVNKPYRAILVDYVINKRYSVDECCQMWQCSKSKFNYMKNHALLEFKVMYNK
jgi:hypothetical protein